jgi:hypothetical protein
LRFSCLHCCCRFTTTRLLYAELLSIEALGGAPSPLNSFDESTNLLDGLR